MDQEYYREDDDAYIYSELADEFLYGENEDDEEE